MARDLPHEVLYGGVTVPVFRRTWRTTPTKLPYRKTYDLKPGQHWKDIGETTKQWEYYVVLEHDPSVPEVEHPAIIYPEDRQFGLSVIPAGAAIAREFSSDGAKFVCFTELWAGKRVLVGPDLVCLPETGEIAQLLDDLRSATNRRMLGGLPDAIALFSDGRVAMRDAKHVSKKYKDQLGMKQHSFASAARQLLGARFDLGVVEWGE